jgi:hypothetical protein
MGTQLFKKVLLTFFLYEECKINIYRGEIMGTACLRKKEASKSVDAPGIEYDSNIDNFKISIIKMKRLKEEKA